MRGIARPCRHTMDPEMKRRWMSHLCGLCLTIRDEAGQASRFLTGYDLLLLSVLVEAQAGRAETETAAPCALRGMRTAQVLPSHNPGARFAAAGSLLAGAAAVEDKVRDDDLPRWAAPVAQRWGARQAERGQGLASESELDPAVFSRAATEAAEAELEAGGSLEDLLAPSGRAVAEMFAHTAVVAGTPANRDPLWRVGDSFGRLAHLLDAADDFHSDRRREAFNPLAATGTEPDAARRMALGLVLDIRQGMEQVDMVDPDLALMLLGPVLERSVSRHLPPEEAVTTGRPGPVAAAVAATGRAAATIATAAAVPALVAGIFGGRRGGRWRRRPPYYDDPYGPPPGYGYGGYGRYGYGRRGPSCCDLLACDCCANMACNDCCGGGDDDCCFCCV
ncbi:MAG TPA: DUF5685 family protein [Acidimicrobiales bacterium]|nr:DUF5685 family protein [Acidimicrobiales bacterium]